MTIVLCYNYFEYQIRKGLNYMRVCIYGASSTKTDEKYILAVEDLGETLAKAGHGLVYGAGANGLMGAAARGFTKGGGHIIGVVPHFFNIDGILYDKCDDTIRTETMRERKQIMEDHADAFVIVPGGVGTFDEFFEILTLKQLGRHQKPIIIYNLFGYYDKMLEFLKVSVAENFVSDVSLGLFEVISDERELLSYLNDYKASDLAIKDTKYI